MDYIMMLFGYFAAGFLIGHFIIWPIISYLIDRK